MTASQIEKIVLYLFLIFALTSQYESECSHCAEKCFGNSCIGQCESGYEKYWESFKIKCKQICTSCQECTSTQYRTENRCRNCQSPCTSCEHKATQCTGCRDGKYLNGNSCYNCKSPCATCSTSATHCESCVDPYQMTSSSNQCLCQSNDSQCITCTSPCTSCSGTATNCTECIDGKYLDGNSCFDCTSPCTTCSTSPTHCESCIDVNQVVIEGLCLCGDQFFQEGNICKQCPTLCQLCTSQYQCQQCIEDVSIVLEDNQCKCQIGYFQTDQNECIECSSKCQSCVLDANHCQSCNALRTLSGKECICKKGYYEKDDECEDCNSQQGHLMEICQYSDCTDNVWTWGEQCDDGNQISRDGCSNCQIDPTYKCLNVLSQPSYCVSAPEYCQTWQLIDIGNINCSQCQLGYFLQNKKCLKCTDRCLECQDTSINCIACRFILIDDQCGLCEQLQGYYSNYQTNSCYSKCGDSFKAENEECDDGNNNDYDGCSSSCLLETGFECDGQQCTLIQYPLPVLKIVGRDIYQNLRSFVLEFDQQLYFKANYSIEELFRFDVGEQLNMSYFYIYLNETKQIEQTNLTNYTVQIDVQFSDSALNEMLNIHFLQMEILTNKYGYSIQVSDISVKIDDYFKLETSTIATTQSTISSNEYMLISLAVLAGVGLLFGGLDIFYNLMDTLQLISYLQYVNTVFPYNLNSFLDLFSFAQLRFLEQYLDTEQLIDGMVPDSYLKSLPAKFQDDSLTPLFLINGGSILSVWVSFLGVYFVSKLAPIFLNRIEIEIYSTDEGIRLKLKIGILMLKYFFLKISQSVLNTFFFSGLIRTHMSTAYDYCFALVLNLYCFKLTSTNLLIKLSSALTIASLIVYLSLILFSAIFSNFNQISIKTQKVQNLCGSIFEGLNETGYSKYYNTFLLIKKLIFMSLLVFPYHVPLYQIVNLLLLSIINSTFIIVFKPLKEKSEYYKQITCEIFLAITEFCLFLFAMDDIFMFLAQNGRLIVGWFSIFSITSILTIQIIIDAIQQWRFIFKKYKSVRKLIDNLQTKIKEYFRPAPKQTQCLIFN